MYGCEKFLLKIYRRTKGVRESRKVGGRRGDLRDGKVELPKEARGEKR